MADLTSLDRKLRLPAMILIIGLIVESVCLLRRGPIAFLLFVGLGGALIMAGVLIYLYSIVGAAVERLKR